MNEIEQHSCGCSWKKSYWLTVAALLFQSFYLSIASAFSLQATSIFISCKQTVQQSSFITLPCTQHCKIINNALPQNISKNPEELFAQVNEPTFTYNLLNQNNAQLSLSHDSSSLLEKHLHPTVNNRIYLTTSRLRI